MSAHSAPTCRPRRHAEEQELLAAKFMGRWRSGAPLVLGAGRRRSRTGRGSERNNDFNYKEMDPFGYACPLGSHARRLNPRDTAHNMNRRRMIRRGATYGPALPDGAPDDGVDRGHRRVHHLRRPGAPVRVRPERLDQRQDLPRTRQRARPDLRHPGRHPGLHRPQPPDPQGAQGNTGLHDAHAAGRTSSCPDSTPCATSPRSATRGSPMHARSHLQPEPHPPRPHRRAAHQHLLDVELSLGSTTRSGRRWRTASPP